MRASQRTIEVGEVRTTYDVVVVGAGPAGCGAAACFNARGASVLLVESNPKAARRFAGEWIHPEGARVLRRQGLLQGLTPRVRASGFVVCPNDGLGLIRLDYPDGTEGFTCEHETLVTHLRCETAQRPGIDYLEGVRAWPTGEGAADLFVGRRRARRVSAARIVVAGGRSARPVAPEGHDNPERVPISSMAGLLIEDAELPLDGFGHVILGGPGPVLAYRINERHIRLCIDVPQVVRPGGDAARWIWDSFSGVLPASIREGLRVELDRGSLSWAANVFRPRRYQTELGVALVGDAAGVFHPLTAMGITMSLLDAEALAGAANLEEYAASRATQSYVPELLSNAIYQAFVREDRGAEAIRESIFAGWRSSPSQRARTMRLLGAASTKRSDFVHAFLRVAFQAGATSLVRDRRALSELGGWLRWPWASVHPHVDSIRTRTLSWAAPETWARDTTFRSFTPNQEKRHAN